MKIVVTSSTFPKDNIDPVPRFVLDQIGYMYKLDSDLKFIALVPHNSYSKNPPNIVNRGTHQEVRYHYFWPNRFERLTGRGILPALKQNPLRYLLVPFFLWAQRNALLKLCRDEKPELIYAHWFMPQAIVAKSVSRKLSIPLVFTTHASDVSILKKLPFSKLIVRSILRHSSACTAVSKRTATKLTSFFTSDEWDHEFAEKLSIIPMGTEIHRELLEPKILNKILFSLGLDQNRKIILCLGRLSEKKGFRYLISAYAQLDRTEKGRYQLVVAGEGQLEGELRNQVKLLEAGDDIIFTGYVSGEKKKALLQAAEIFVIPSVEDDSGDSEGLPVVLMEALAFGKNIIATNVSGAEEVIDEFSGILINQKSSGEIVDAIRHIISLDKKDVETMKKFAVQAASGFDWDSVAIRHYRILTKVVERL